MSQSDLDRQIAQLRNCENITEGYVQRHEKFLLKKAMCKEWMHL
ncbi:unnamed protein product [Paramecium sonneborni]|uniref:Uncharacterized protein n=1 Tax=Paramecium sonneborni TaxID=65129 RepID=A0A8S1RG54_9CILI|nr:unnamed protein product [Paramecium sonneborni]